VTSTPPTESVPTDNLPRDRQRTALRELVRLATESAAAEAAIEAEYAQLKAEAQEKHERSLWSLDQRAESQRGQIVEKHTERTAAAREQKTAAEQQARAADKQLRAKVAGEYQQSASEIRKKLDHAIWLADSMLEGTQAKLKQDGKKAAEELENQSNAVGEVAGQAAASLHIYGQPDLALQTPEIELPPSEEPAQALYERHLEAARVQSTQLGRMPIPRLFVGVWPFIIVVLLMGGAGAFTHFILNNGGEPDAKSIGIAVGGALVFSLIVGVALRVLAKRQVRAAWGPLSESLELARLSAVRKSEDAAAERRRQNEAATERRNAEVKSIKDRMAPVTAKTQKKRDDALAAADVDLNGKLASINEIFTRNTAEADAWRDGRDQELAAKLDDLKRAEHARYTQQLADAAAQYKQRRDDLEKRLADGLKATEAPTASRHHTGAASPRDWNDPAWQSWQPTPAGCVHDHRPGRPGAELRRLHAPGRPRRGPRRRAHLDRPEHIEQRLTDLTEHMETVIQKYLRNEFETIDDYNAQAGELAEPYRFLVIADFPDQLQRARPLRRLSSIAATAGARCGVYTLIARDTRQPMPADAHRRGHLEAAQRQPRARGRAIRLEG
jgi:DNA segregation ATPase FtsK/SpoIIIE, S-DNA-T family